MLRVFEEPSLNKKGEHNVELLSGSPYMSATITYNVRPLSYKLFYKPQKL